MLYKSTRNDKLKVTASQAISQGISEEGGLFVPDVIPSIKDDLSRLAEMDYYGRAKEILKLYLSDFTEERLLTALITHTHQRSSRIPNRLRWLKFATARKIFIL